MLLGLSVVLFADVMLEERAFVSLVEIPGVHIKLLLSCSSDCF